jgi:hypothetical protein
MKYLFKDPIDWPVLPNFHEVNNLTWGCFNFENASISPDSWDFKDTVHYPQVLGPIGLHRELDWAFAATWYQHGEHWQGFIPKMDDHNAKNWFEVGEQPLDINRVNDKH